MQWLSYAVCHNDILVPQRALRFVGSASLLSRSSRRKTEDAILETGTLSR